jgi:hypothetical protein
MNKHSIPPCEPWPEREPILSAEHTIVALGAAPDPRLVEVVRFLARRAARRWFEQQMSASERDEE